MTGPNDSRWQLLELLSRYLDNECSADDRLRAQQAMADPKIQQLFKRLRRTTSAVTQAITRHPPASPAAPSSTCLDEATWTQLADGTLPSKKRSLVESHLLECDHCLLQLAEHLHIGQVMERGEWPQLPPELAAQFAPRALRNLQEAEPQQEIHLLELPAPEREVRRHSLIGESGLKTHLTFTPLHDDPAYHLHADLRGKRPLCGYWRIDLHAKPSRRKLASVRTNAAGLAEIRRLPPGNYALQIHGTDLLVDVHIEDIGESPPSPTGESTT